MQLTWCLIIRVLPLMTSLLGVGSLTLAESKCPSPRDPGSSMCRFRESPDSRIMQGSDAASSVGIGMGCCASHGPFWACIPAPGPALLNLRSIGHLRIWQCGVSSIKGPCVSARTFLGRMAGHSDGPSRMVLAVWGTRPGRRRPSKLISAKLRDSMLKHV